MSNTINKEASLVGHIRAQLNIRGHIQPQLTLFGRMSASIPEKSSSDLTVSGKTVSVPAGVYISPASKSVSDGSIDLKVLINGNVVGDDVTDYEISVTPSAQVNAGYVSGNQFGDAVKKYIQVQTTEATPSTSEQDITPSSGYLLNRVHLNAVSLNGNATASDVLAGKTFYNTSLSPETGTAPAKSSSDLTVSGKTVSVPAGFYTNPASKSVADGSVTPTANVSGDEIGDTVTDYEINVMPSATVSSGYVSGNKTGTNIKKYVQVEEKTATPSIYPQEITPSSGKLLKKVTVNPVELPTGSISITENGSYDVTNYANANVNVSGGSSGFKIYLFHINNANDGGTIKINGSIVYKLTDTMPDTTSFYFSASSWANNLDSVETFKLWGFDHRSTYPDTSSSWARYRPHSGGAWTNITLVRTEADAQTITLTEDIDLEVLEATCLSKGTLISMADGTKKKIEDIIIGDVVKTYTGEGVVYKDEHNNRAFGDDRDIWNFENGYQIITTYRHEFYNVEQGKMTYLDEWNIGEHAITEDDSKVKLIEHIHEDVPCKYYSLWCDGGNNYYANGLLAGNRFTEGIWLHDGDEPE